MNFVRCFDVVGTVVEEASGRFKLLFKPSEKLIHVLKNNCSLIDELAARHNAISYEVKVDEINMSIRIDMECADVTIEDLKDSTSILGLLSDVAMIEFSASSNTNLLVSFTLPGVWVRG